MSRPRRVAVTAPPEPGVRARPVGARPSPETTLDPVHATTARAARRAQLHRAGRTLACGAVLLFGLPVLLRLAPEAAAVRLFGLPAGWVAVALLPYPLLAALAWWHLRGAERTERATAPAPGPGAGEPGEPVEAVQAGDTADAGEAAPDRPGRVR